MKKATALVLLAISSMAGPLAAEVSAPNATVTTLALSQFTPARQASAVSPLRVPGTLTYLPPRNAVVCRDFRTVISYWGFQGISGEDSCPVICGGCFCHQMTNKLVGQVIYECDGSTTSWGLNCDQSYTICNQSRTITDEPCPSCGM